MFAKMLLPTAASSFFLLNLFVNVPTSFLSQLGKVLSSFRSRMRRSLRWNVPIEYTSIRDYLTSTQSNQFLRINEHFRVLLSQSYCVCFACYFCTYLDSFIENSVRTRVAAISYM